MDRTTAKGVLLILLATLCIVLMNTCAKASSVSHGPVEMVFDRGVVALFLLVPYMLATHSFRAVPIDPENSPKAPIDN